MDHDTGFAPNTDCGICTLSGCKNSKNQNRKNIEELAVEGSWVIGIGGNGTGKPNKLIYAMEVEENLEFPDFTKKYRACALKKYPKPKHAGTNVLVSKKSFYFGDNALDLPNELKDIIIRGRGYKCNGITEDVVDKLKKYIEECGYRNYGVFGRPCNAYPRVRSTC